MDRSSTEDYGAGCMSSSQTEDISAGQQCQSVDSRAEWRSSEQLENGTPSTSPPYWDTDVDDDGGGPKPSELYRKFTWKIENYSQINKRELRSNAFEVGGYKWYILIYPQGCDVCNHLSLFLCVANHDKLLPGWSHFAQFTISVVNKDPKFSKFSDTLHRFWKKEHDWGWKKFMELSKVEDGFVNNETLVIKAQVQVIREKANRLFRCLDCQYRRELVQVYLSNVEQICRRFFEDRKNKLSKLIDDKVRWSSFCSFWLGVDQNSKRRIARDKLDTILRVVVKHFFVEKEVTSTLVMDSLYSGLKALQCQSKNKKEGLRVEMEESAVPMVSVDEDMFTLADDVISLLERVASEPLPAVSLPSKDDRISLNRSKEGSSADEFKDSIERDERRLTELGRRTVEIFVLVHIFSNRIEVAYQEAIAFKRQEDLIREEEAAGQAEQELKARRAAAEKDKRTKKKQRKQKRNNRKKKEKNIDLKSDSAFNDRNQEEKSLAELASGESSLKRIMDTPEDASDSDVSYNGDDVDEPLYPDLDDRDRSPRNWDTDESDLRPSIEANAGGEISNRRPEKTNLGLDDGSSTCSTDSVPSLAPKGTSKGSSLTIGNIRTSPNRARGYGSRDLQKHRSVASHPFEILDSSSSTGFELGGDDGYQKRLVQGHETHLVEKRKPTAILLEKTSNDQGAVQKNPLNIRPLESSSSILPYSVRKPQPVLQQPKQSAQNSTTASRSITPSTAPPAPLREPPSTHINAPKRSPAPSAKSPYSSTSRSEPPRRYPTPVAKNITAAQPAAPFSRPSSAALIPVAPKSTAAAISRSAGATGPLAVDPSLPSPTYVPQSYLNAIIGRTAAGSNPAGLAHSAPIPLSRSSSSSSQSTFLSSSASLFPPPLTSRIDRPPASRAGFIYGSVEPAAMLPQSIRRANADLWSSDHQRETVPTARFDPSHCGLSDEFPHIGIIDDLLNEEQSTSNPYHRPLHHRHRSFNGPYSFPDGAASAELSLLNHSPGAFHQTQQYYDDGFLGFHGGASGRPLDGHFAPADFPAAYANFQMGGRIQSQRPYRPANLSLTNLDGRANRGDGAYSYNSVSDYINQGHGPGGRRWYRP